MRTADTVYSIRRERGKRGLPLERVQHLLYNEELYLRAYAKLYPNKGAMTKGITDEIVDAMSRRKIQQLITELRQKEFRWTPVRRIHIPKKKGTRPLGIPTWRDKLLQEVIRSILEEYYEPQLSNTSHGFRPRRGCHTALQQIQGTWTGTRWFLEGDISKYFDKLSQELLIEVLKEHIHDGRFIKLLQDLLDAGYMEDWTYNQTLSGVPQGGIGSPILSNILLDKLDKFVENVLIPQYTRGSKRKINPEYDKLRIDSRNQRRKGDTEKAEELRKQSQTLPSVMTNDPDYRRLKYVRYADDFVVRHEVARDE